jgi:RimJ/RimL family protein N-acetyltransferase
MLKGENIILVPPRREFIDIYLKWMTDPEITQYLMIFRPITREIEEEWFNSLKNNPNSFLFSIIFPKENLEILIGNCSIDVDWKNRVGNCGIVIGEKEYQGRGYGTEAMKLLVSYGFNTLNLNRIELETYSFNTRAFKSYLRVGYKEEGRRRQAIYVDGEYYDSIFFGILKEEWKKS